MVVVPVGLVVATKQQAKLQKKTEFGGILENSDLLVGF
jgi:hypothetical protein